MSETIFRAGKATRSTMIKPAKHGRARLYLKNEDETNWVKTAIYFDDGRFGRDDQGLAPTDRHTSKGFSKYFRIAHAKNPKPGEEPGRIQIDGDVFAPILWKLVEEAKQ